MLGLRGRVWALYSNANCEVGGWQPKESGERPSRASINLERGKRGEEEESFGFMHDWHRTGEDTNEQPSRRKEGTHANCQWLRSKAAGRASDSCECHFLFCCNTSSLIAPRQTVTASVEHEHRDNSFGVMRFNFDLIWTQFYTRKWVKNESKLNRITPETIPLEWCDSILTHLWPNLYSKSKPSQNRIASLQ